METSGWSVVLTGTPEGLLKGAWGDAELLSIGIDKMADVGVAHLGGDLAYVLGCIPEQGVGGFHPVLLEAAEDGGAEGLFEALLQLEFVDAGEPCLSWNGGGLLDILEQDCFCRMDVFQVGRVWG
jgi:hypothetical protein